MMMRSEHWSSYWARGCLTSLPQDFHGNYDGEVAAFWHRQFAAAPDTARILDVCTGNGAIALLAADYGRQHRRTFEITGVDAARIDPAAIGRHDREYAGLAQDITFIGQCCFEALDRPAGYFDLIVSQYGMEYCDWEAAAAQAAGLLKPGGGLAIVSHAASSDMLKTMAAEHAEYTRLIELKVLPALEAFCQHHIGPARLRAALGQAVPALRRDYNQSRSALYRYVLGIAERVDQMDDDAIKRAEADIAAAARQVSDGHYRLQDMLQVNRRIAENPDWHAVFARHGLSMQEQGELHYRGRHRAGYCYCYRKTM